MAKFRSSFGSLTLQGDDDATPYAQFENGTFETDDAEVARRLRDISDGSVTEVADEPGDAPASPVPLGTGETIDEQQPPESGRPVGPDQRTEGGDGDLTTGPTTGPTTDTDTSDSSNSDGTDGKARGRRRGAGTSEA